MILFPQVADIVDRNQDNVITTAEVVIGFGDILGYQCKQSLIVPPVRDTADELNMLCSDIIKMRFLSVNFCYQNIE